MEQLPDVSTRPPAKSTTIRTAPDAAANHEPKTGRFVAGNKAGLLPRRKQEIVALKENLEYAVRGPAGPLSADRVCRIVRKMCDMALNGDVKAARLILGIAMSPSAEDKTSAPPQIVITVENATFSAVKATASQEPPIDGEYTTKE